MKRTSMIARITCLFLASLILLETPAVTTSQTQHHYYNSSDDVIHDVPTEQKVIALSFDDGPNPVYTPQVLDLLKQYNAKATFFVIGSRVQVYQELAKREMAEGHEIANHTFSHRMKLSNRELQEDLAKAQEEVFQVTGRAPRLFRPPGGFYDPKLVAIAKQMGCQVVMWSNDPRDWSEPGSDKIVREVVSHVYNGVIVILHDHGSHCPQTIKALGRLLPELQEKGYRFVTISELLKIKNNRQPTHSPK